MAVKVKTAPMKVGFGETKKKRMWVVSSWVKPWIPKCW